jgi:hypothetical protein
MERKIMASYTEVQSNDNFLVGAACVSAHEGAHTGAHLQKRWLFDRNSVLHNGEKLKKVNAKPWQ